MTKLLLAPDSTMYKTPDGKYWCPTIYEFSFFERYLDVFEEIVVVSRVKEVTYDKVAGYLRCDGNKMNVVDLPDFHGVTECIKGFKAFVEKSRLAVQNVDCAIFRLPSIPATMVLHFYLKTQKKYALEVVVDPAMAYASNILAKHWFKFHLKKFCLKANGVSYVTKSYLQNKYPSYVRKFGIDNNHFESFYSTIKLDRDFFGNPRHYKKKQTFVIIHTANNMNNKIKGHNELLLAVSHVIRSGYDVKVRFVGDGRMRAKLEKKAKRLGLQDKVLFIGRLSDMRKVRDELLRADLFVFPTKAEGLPRSLIEAMATGLPCISTPVAGIPELLEEEDMIPAHDIKRLSSRIIELISSPEIMEKKSIRNIDIARNYSDEILHFKRIDFYKQLKQISTSED